MTEMSESRMDELQGGDIYTCVTAVTLTSGIFGALTGGVGFAVGFIAAYNYFC